MADQHNNGGMARAFAESRYEQNLAASADRMRELLADHPKLLQEMNRFAQLTNTKAAERLMATPKSDRTAMYEEMHPLFRLGLSIALFAMEDKYGTPES